MWTFFCKELCGPFHPIVLGHIKIHAQEFLLHWLIEYMPSGMAGSIVKQRSNDIHQFTEMWKHSKLLSMAFHLLMKRMKTKYNICRNGKLQILVSEGKVDGKNYLIYLQ